MDFFHPLLGYLSSSQSFVLNDINYPANWLRTASNEDRTSLGFVPVTYGAKPDEKWYIIEEVRNNGNITYSGTPKEIEILKQLKLADLANYRYNIEIGGCVFNGSAVATDLDSQSKINAAYVALTSGIVSSIQWKSSSSSFVTLDATSIKALATAVVGHVQACFNNELTHSTAINTLVDQFEIISYDFSSGWPANPKGN